MIETPSTERRAPPTDAEAYRALYLLPTAPRPLISAVYQRLARDLAAAVRDEPDRRAQLEALQAAYATAISRGPPLNGHDATSRTELRPWELLHVTRDAPPEVVAIAYEYWRSGMTEAAPAGAPAAAFASADERLAALAGRRDGGRPGRPREGLARLVAAAGDGEAGRAFPVGAEPLRIGTDPTFEVVVASRAGRKHRVEARLWSHGGRYVLHVVDAPASAVRLNGQAVIWAVLDHGDRLEIAGEPLRFERSDDER